MFLNRDFSGANLHTVENRSEKWNFGIGKKKVNESLLLVCVVNLALIRKGG